MKRGIHLISGLPRSGSTLLSAILLQNPALYAGITSPVSGLVTAMLREMSQGNESAIFIDNSQREAILKGVFKNYYGRWADKTVFDTSRAWCIRLNLISVLFPEAKVICCVRDLPWILDSIERLVRQNRWELSKIFNFDAGGTVYSRCEGLSARSGMVGFAYNAVKQAMHSEESDRLMIVTYDTLTSRPADVLDAIYKFTGIEPFAHDFENVEFDAEEFDARLGTPGLHRVRRAVRSEHRGTVLPPDVWNRHVSDSFWTDPAFNVRKVPIL